MGISVTLVVELDSYRFDNGTLSRDWDAFQEDGKHVTPSL